MQGHLADRFRDGLSTLNTLALGVFAGDRDGRQAGAIHERELQTGIAFYGR